MPDTERFQSTPSLRRATAIIIEGPLRLQVSIHALLAESDPAAPSLGAAVNVFQSTPSLRRATYGVRVGPVVGDVSIHALLAESDDQLVLAPANCSLFQSTPSLRRATPVPGCCPSDGMFQSTPSLRRATAPTVHVVNQSCKRGFAPTSRRRHITYRLLFIMFECQSTFSNVLQESPTSRQFDVSLGLAQRPCQTALK